MNPIKQFFTDIVNVGKTRKFWMSFAGAVGSAALVFLADQPEFAPAFVLLSTLGVYSAPNNKK